MKVPIENMEHEAYAKVGEFAFLEVVSTGEIGAFLDVGIDKDLLLPFREQTRELRAGDWVVVYVYVDNTGRDCASMRTDKYVQSSPGDYHEEDRVELLIANRTDLGFRAIIENRHYGVIYANEIFRVLETGERIDGFIKKIRPDGKIDLALQQTGNKDAAYIGDQILAAIDAEDGFLPVHDKSPAEEIYDRFGVSKKKFKAAVGGLLKRGCIVFEDEGIRRAR